jgi:hypothetical protein
MPNSQVTAALTITVQDLTIPGAAGLVNHVIPPLVFLSPGSGGLGVTYGGYTTLLPGSSINIISGGIPTTPFIFVRNVGPSLCALTIAWSSGGPSNVPRLASGAWFMFGSPGLDAATDNGIIEATVSSLNNTGTVIEYLVAS